MKARYLVIALVILTAAAVLNSAQEEWDTSDRNAYLDPQFYEETNPVNWNYDYVQWERIPEDKIGDIPADKLRFDKMRPSQLRALTKEQVSKRIRDIKPEHVGVVRQLEIHGCAKLAEGIALHHCPRDPTADLPKHRIEVASNP